ncbi:hypothetical protein Z043_111475 [Scleropages formosus]|uniref:Transposase Tc1-like domain-containing protein n=1 Tax=Scleropages formosus TaxID=113540 RepID=A0A0P7WZW2_SCLFO|nr:hypothetical protein Z043_111475 [Scleropages formosus]
MGKHMDLSGFDKGQIVMARQLGRSISKTAGLVGCSRCAVVSTYQKWSRKDNWLIDACGERKLTHLVRSHRRATIALIAENLNAGHDRKVSEHTLHHSLLHMGLCSRRPVRVPMLTPFTTESAYSGQMVPGSEQVAFCNSTAAAAQILGRPPHLSANIRPSIPEKPFCLAEQDNMMKTLQCPSIA